MQGLQKSQNNLEKEEQSSSFLISKQTPKSRLTRLCGPGLGLDAWINGIVSESGNKSIHLWSIDFLKKCQDQSVGGDDCFQ